MTEFRLKLRSYQKPLMSEINNFIQQEVGKPLENDEVPGINRNAVVTAPCSFGKTICAVYLMHQAHLNKIPSLFILPYTPLIWSSYEALTLATGITPNIIWAQWKAKKYGAVDPNSFLTIASTGTLGNRELPEAGLVIVDEAHTNLFGATMTRVFHEYANSWILGLTATPERLNKKEGMSQRYSRLIVGAHAETLIDLGAKSGYKEGIVPFKYYGLPHDNEINLDGVRTSMGDFNQSDLQEKCNTSAVNSTAVQAFKEHLFIEERGCFARTIAFCTGVEHSKALRDEFNSDPELSQLYPNGIAAHLDGEASQDERQAVYRLLRTGQIAVITSVDLLAVGFDMKCIEGLLDLQPTKSAPRHIQKLGRLARICNEFYVDRNGDETKDPSKGVNIMVDVNGNPLPKTYGRVIDIAGNVTRLGRKGFFELYKPSKLDDPQDSNGEAPEKKCPECGTFMPTFATECPKCHYVFPPKELSERVGKIVELLKPDEKVVYNIFRRKMRQTYSQGWVPGRAWFETKSEVERKNLPLCQIRPDWKLGAIFKGERNAEVAAAYLKHLIGVAVKRPTFFKQKKWHTPEMLKAWLDAQIKLEFGKEIAQELWWNDLEGAINQSSARIPQIWVEHSKSASKELAYL